MLYINKLCTKKSRHCFFGKTSTQFRLKSEGKRKFFYRKITIIYDRPVGIWVRHDMWRDRRSGIWAYECVHLSTKLTRITFILYVGVFFSYDCSVQSLWSLVCTTWVFDKIQLFDAYSYYGALEQYGLYHPPIHCSRILIFCVLLFSMTLFSSLHDISRKVAEFLSFTRGTVV